MEKSGKIADFSEMADFFADFSAIDLHAPGRRVGAAIFVDLSAIKSKNHRFFVVFSAISPELSWPLDFFCF